MVELFLSLALSAQVGAALPPDTVDRRRSRARAAEANFERRARALAPFSWGGFDGRSCDEVVGRFCLKFETSGTRPTASEVGPVVDARREAIEAARRYFSAAPARRGAAGPLVRLLVLDDRAAEAVSAATTFAALSTDTLWAHLLLGLAHHAAGRTPEAERNFVLAVAQLDERTRRDWLDPRWLLDHREQRVLNRMSASERAEYERRFWLVSDPLWLTAPNERWVEHIARHTEARLLADVPLVAGMFRWGRDLDQLTVRYGIPRSRAQIRGNMPWDASSFVEYYDTAQRAYSPERLLSEGFPEPPLPGETPPLYAGRVRSAYALRTVTRVLDLPHQATRFPAGEHVVIRVDAALPSPARGPLPGGVSGGMAGADRAGDAAAEPRRGRTLELGLFAYDSAFTRRTRMVRAAAWSGDTTSFTLSVTAPPGQVIYSVEALDTAADFAARARYTLPAFVPDTGPVVSDLLLARPFPPGRLPTGRDDPVLRGLPHLRLGAGDTMGVYAEVSRLSSREADGVRIEVSLEPGEAPGLLTQFARWIGRAAGIVQPRTDPRVSWRAEAEDGTYPIALNVPLERGRTGRHVLVLRVTDMVTGASAESRRILLIEEQPGG
jgi:hypothetical protein